jgi:hypothetical protein
LNVFPVVQDLINIAMDRFMITNPALPILGLGLAFRREHLVRPVDQPLQKVERRLNLDLTFTIDQNPKNTLQNHVSVHIQHRDQLIVIDTLLNIAPVLDPPLRALIFSLKKFLPKHLGKRHQKAPKLHSKFFGWLQRRRRSLEYLKSAY